MDEPTRFCSVSQVNCSPSSARRVCASRADQFRDDVKALHDTLNNGKVDSEAASEAKSNGKGRRPRD
jgi:hypothetical protein